MDGKTLRGSLRRGGKGDSVHLVNAWLRDSGLCLGRLKTPSKSNEMKAIPQLLSELNLRNATVSIDAAGCYKETAQAIISQKGEYCIAVKANQPTLYADVQRLFAEGLDLRRRTVDELVRPEVESYSDTDGGHGRIEVRTAYISTDLTHLTTANEWPGLQAVGMIVSETMAALAEPSPGLPSTLTIGRHTECGLHVVGDPCVALRHLMLAIAPGSGSLEIVDLRTDTGFDIDSIGTARGALVGLPRSSKRTRA